MRQFEKQIAEIFGARIEKFEHLSDIYRLIALYKIGGVYLDLDSWIIQPIDRFLQLKRPTLGHPSRCTISNAFISTPRNDEFIRIWLYQYKYYSISDYKKEWSKRGHSNHVPYWRKFSVDMAWALWKTHPSKVNVEEIGIMRPTLLAMSNFRYGFYDWRDSFVVHTSESDFKGTYRFKNRRKIVMDKIHVFKWRRFFKKIFV